MVLASNEAGTVKRPGHLGVEVHEVNPSSCAIVMHIGYTIHMYTYRVFPCLFFPSLVLMWQARSCYSNQVDCHWAMEQSDLDVEVVLTALHMGHRNATRACPYMPSFTLPHDQVAK